MWDCCCGTGNLEVGLTNKYNVWVSTLDQQDVDVIHQRIKLGANLLDSHVFQFDFLNDSFDKLPPGLKEIIDDPERRKRLVIYINPPYAEAGDAKQRSGTGMNKTDVSVTRRTFRSSMPHTTAIWKRSVSQDESFSRSSSCASTTRFPDASLPSSQS